MGHFDDRESQLTASTENSRNNTTSLDRASVAGGNSALEALRTEHLGQQGQAERVSAIVTSFQRSQEFNRLMNSTLELGGRWCPEGSSHQGVAQIKEMLNLINEGRSGWNPLSIDNRIDASFVSAYGEVQKRWSTDVRDHDLILGDKTLRFILDDVESKIALLRGRATDTSIASDLRVVDPAPKSYDMLRPTDRSGASVNMRPSHQVTQEPEVALMARDADRPPVDRARTMVFAPITDPTVNAQVSANIRAENDGKFSWLEAGKNLLKGAWKIVPEVISTTFEHPYLVVGASLATGAALAYGGTIAVAVVTLPAMAFCGYKMFKFVSGYASTDQDQRERSFAELGEGLTSAPLGAAGFLGLGVKATRFIRPVEAFVQGSIRTLGLSEVSRGAMGWKKFAGLMSLNQAKKIAPGVAILAESDSAPEVD